MFLSHLALAQYYWKQTVQPGSIAIDATCGNGHDSLFLAKTILTPASGYLYSLDIQSRALQQTHSLLKKNLAYELLSRIEMRLQCHTTISNICSSVDLVVYNLGYLPGGDHNITTSTRTTLQSLEQAFILAQAISIIVYPGHPEGKREKESVLKLVRSLPSSAYQVCHHDWILKNNSPILLWVKKTSH
jgi:hypothetical protein